MVYRLNETTWLQDAGGGAEIFYFLNWAILTIGSCVCPATLPQYLTSAMLDGALYHPLIVAPSSPLGPFARHPTSACRKASRSGSPASPPTATPLLQMGIISAEATPFIPATPSLTSWKEINMPPFPAPDSFAGCLS